MKPPSESAKPESEFDRAISGRESTGKIALLLQVVTQDSPATPVGKNFILAGELADFYVLQNDKSTTDSNNFDSSYYL